MPNRLARESSPYLLQHKDNPVDWYPWGDEALSRAKSENKPILLSVGYSACHWCHVMEHESFENAEIARLMNESFVCIKVDREERPDLDQIYQNVAQALTRSGGWPLTVFLTPALKPFYGGTYFPPEDRWGRPGFPRLLEALARAFREEPAAISENARKLDAFIGEVVGARAGEPGAPGGLPRLEDLSLAAETLASHVDLTDGGLGGAPKFPNAMTFSFLWRMGLALGARAPGEACLEAVYVTLRKMARGGIYDQLGGGFHRYSVDAHWAVPHFEKMLYDNGLLLKLYAEALLARNPEGATPLKSEDRELFADVLEGAVDYVLREMVAPEGAFFAAQDADSEGEEGKYFVFDRADLEAAGLMREEADFAAQAYGISEGGNFEHGKTVLWRPDGAPSDRAAIDRVRTKLFAYRAKRVPPATDTKILASWNGLMISGLAWASRALHLEGRAAAAERALAAARRAFAFIETKMAKEGDRLYATFQGGVSKLNAYLDDYAFLAMAALDLARVSENAESIGHTLGRARAWVNSILRHFSAEPGFFFTSDDHENLIHRPRSDHDQAIPSGAAVTLQCLAALAEIDGSAEYATRLESELAALFPLAKQSPHGCAELLSAGLLALLGPIVVSGREAIAGVRHAHVFQKAPTRDQAGRLLLCHERACLPAIEQPDQLARELWARLRVPEIR